MGDVDILVFVNQPFEDDPRVNRAVHFLGGRGYRLTVVSGVPEGEVPPPRDYEWGRVYYLRTFKAGRIRWTKRATRVAATQTKKASGSTVEKVRIPRLKRLFIWLLYLGQVLNLAVLNLRILVYAYRLPARLYYPNDIDVAGAAVLLSRLRGGRLLYETHEFHVDQSAAHPDWYKRLVLAVEGWVVRRSDGVIVVGEYIARAIQAQYQIDSLPAVIKNCPPYEAVTKPPREDGPYKLLYHGVYQPKRGLEYLILAMHQIEGAHLYLRGFGYWEEPLRHLVEEEKLAHKVTFLPPLPMQKLVAEAAPFDVGVGAFQDVNLSIRYCLPNKIFEYLMAGLALAVSDLPELRRVVDDYRVGVTFNPADPTDIAHQINTLLANPDRLQAMQSRALQAARDEFNFAVEGEKLTRLVADLIGPPEEITDG